MQPLKINIAGLIINVFIDNEFKNIKNFLSDFEDLENSNAEVTVHIKKNDKRNVEISKQWKDLYISGDKIDDLSDSFNLIGITQALFRFAAIHLIRQGIFLLHGSASVLDTKIVCFGDDGSSTAKTLSSLEVALESKKYVADEFCFLDSKNQIIFGYPSIPIHFRPTVREHVESKHGTVFEYDDYKESKAGWFIKPNKIFKTISGKLDVLSYTHFSDKAPAIEKLSQKEATRSFKFCIASHIAKLLYPELDRMQFVSMTDTTEAKNIDEDTINDILTRICNNPGLEIVQKFSSYKLTVSEPCQIVSLLKKEILL